MAGGVLFSQCGALRLANLALPPAATQCPSASDSSLKLNGHLPPIYTHGEGLR